MNKVLAFLLTLSMVLSCFGGSAVWAADSSGYSGSRVFYAATPSNTSTTGTSVAATGPSVDISASAKSKVFSDISGLPCEEAVKVLSNLKVISGYSDGTFRPSAVVTRAEMASLIVKALGMDGYDGGRSLFTDTKGHWAENYITYANSIGVISGRSATIFDPDTTVSYDEAVTMLVKALGYTDAVLTDNWPLNYVSKAQDLGILKDIQSGSSGANRGDCAIMLYQTLDQYIGNVRKGVFEITSVYKKGITDANAAPGTLAPDTMMVRLGIVMLPEFIVRGNEDSLINLKDYQGACVSAYQNSDGDIIGIKEEKSIFLTGKFQDSYNKFKTDSETYSLAGSAYRPDQVYLFEQGGFTPTIGVPLTQLVMEDEYTLAAEVSGRQIRKIYSVSKWDSITAEATATIVNNIKNGKKINTTVKFYLDDYDKIDMNEFSLAGVPTLSAIKTGNVLTYSVDSDNYVKKLAVGTQVITGPVSKLSGDKEKVTIDGKEYEMYDGSAFKDEIKVGNTVKLTLTYSGKVFKAERSGTTSKDTYGIVIAISLGDNASSSIDAEDPQIKLYTSAGTEKVFDLDAKALVDGNYLAENSGNGKVSYVTAGTINAELGKNTVVKYDLNTQGKINVLEVVPAAKMKLVTSMKVTAQGALDGHAISADAVLFIADHVDSDGSKYVVEKDYSTTTKTRLLKKTLTSAVYALNDKEQIGVMVLQSNSASDDLYAVINDFYSDNSDAGYGVELIMDGTKATYHTKNNYSSLVGPASALQKVKLKADGTIDSLTEIKADQEKVITKITGSGVTFIEDNGRLKIASTQANADSEDYDIFNKMLGDKVVIYAWDHKEDEWVVGDTSDLNDALTKDDEFIYIYELDSVDNPATVTHVVVYKK